MEKPRVFASPINKIIHNSQEVYYERNNSYQKEIHRDQIDINKKINDIFNSSHHVYKSKVSIKTNNGNVICDIVGKTANSLLTLDGKTILIANIIDIKKI